LTGPARPDPPGKTGMVKAVHMSEGTNNRKKDAASEELRLRETALIEMAKAYRGLAMYPKGHPQRTKLIAQAHQGLQKVLGQVGELSFQVGRTSFLYEDNKVGSGQESLRELAEDMHLRQVKSFSLRRELTAADLTAFMEMLQQDAENFRQGRFIEKWLTGRQVSTIWVNEIDFSRMVTSMEEAEEEEREEGEGEQDQPSLDDQIEEVLRLLGSENDPEAFDQLLRELEVLVRPLIEEKEYNKAWWPISTVLLESDEQKRPGPAGESVRARIKKSLDGLIDKPYLMHLLDRYGKANVSDPAFHRHLFNMLGDRTINAALDTIARTEAMGAYRPLLELIMENGEKAVPLLMGRLGENEDPVLVRKAVYLLGELKDRRAIESIRLMLSHSEDKVRREAIKALVNYNSKEASRVLITYLHSERSQQVRMLVIQALGASRDLAAVAPLIKLLESTPLREDTVELLEAVINALGKIGSREALPVVIKTLKRKSLFNRSLNYRLRVAAAGSLANLGGENAKQALARYANPKKSGELERKCAESLEYLLQQDGA